MKEIGENIGISDVNEVVVSKTVIKQAIWDNHGFEKGTCGF